MESKITAFNEILSSFKIKAHCVNYFYSDNYSYYDLQLFGNCKVRDIQKYSDEISLILKSKIKPVCKIIHEKGIVRLEFFAKRKFALNYYYMINNLPPAEGEINCCLGESYDNKKIWIDLAQNPHMLIAGTTGSGKSVLLHNLIANLLIYNNIDIFLIDPKKIEFDGYASLPNCTVIQSFEESLTLLNSLNTLMEYRYSIMRQGFLDIKPIVLIIDEFSDLIFQDKTNEFYDKLCLLAQKCRAAKIHIVLSTQRPSADIINGNIKANFPARISCKVGSHFDSKIILETSGAEDLLGAGDSIIKNYAYSNERFQVAYANCKDTIQYLEHKAA